MVAQYNTTFRRALYNYTDISNSEALEKNRYELKPYKILYFWEKMPKDLDYTMRLAHTLDFTYFGSTTDNKRPKAA